MVHVNLELSTKAEFNRFVLGRWGIDLDQQWKGDQLQEFNHDNFLITSLAPNEMFIETTQSISQLRSSIFM